MDSVGFIMAFYYRRNQVNLGFIIVRNYLSLFHGKLLESFFTLLLCSGKNKNINKYFISLMVKKYIKDKSYNKHVRILLQLETECNTNNGALIKSSACGSFSSFKYTCLRGLLVSISISF